MRIGIDIRSLQNPYRTGIGTYTADLLTALFTIDTTNDYFLFGNSVKQEMVPRWMQPNVHLVYTRYPNKLLNTSLCLLQQPKLDTIVAKQAAVPSLDYFFSPHLNFTALSPNTRHILTVHDLTFDLFPQFLTRRQRLWHQLVWPKKQCRAATIIFTPSENTKRDLIDYYRLPENKIKVLYPGIAELLPVPSTAQKQNYIVPEKYILFLGTIEPRKNIPALITAFEQFYKTNQTYSLVIAGAPGWKDAEIKKMIVASPVGEKIVRLNFIAEQDKASLYRNAALFIYPSIYEGFGFPVLEAMQAGVPVITSNRSSLPEITDSAAYLINPHRPAEIAGGMERILNTPALANYYRTAGLEQIKKFRWEKTAEDWLATITHV